MTSRGSATAGRPPWCSKRSPAPRATSCTARVSGARTCAACWRRFDVARFALGASTPLTTPDGRPATAEAWAAELGIAYTPTLVFFDDTGKEVFRIDAYLRPFHLAAALDYVASGSYRAEPSFQRFIQDRATQLRASGQTRRLVALARCAQCLPRPLIGRDPSVRRERERSAHSVAPVSWRSPPASSR